MSGALKLGTRGSALALWQAEWVRAALARSGIAARLEVIKTRGDADVDLHLLIHDDRPPRAAMQDVFDAGHRADRVERRRRIGRAADQHERADERFEAPRLPGGDERLEARTRGCKLPTFTQRGWLSSDCSSKW